MERRFCAEHLATLRAHLTELYTKKFPWADPVCLASLIANHEMKVLEGVDEAAYVSEIDGQHRVAYRPPAVPNTVQHTAELG